MCLDETPAAFIRKALPLGLEESDGFWQRDASGRAQKSKQDPRMQSTQFRKGRTPEVSRNYLPIGRACASSKIDGLRERLQMTTRCQPIAGSQSTASRRFIQACAKAFFVKVCASVCTITPCSLRRICAVYAVDPSSRFLADMVPMVPSTTSIIRSTDCSPDHGKSGFSGVFQGATHGATDSQKCQ